MKKIAFYITILILLAFASLLYGDTWDNLTGKNTLYSDAVLNTLHAETLPQQPSNYNEPGAGTSTNPYKIENLANLRWLSEMPSDWWIDDITQVHFIQRADIDAQETINWNEGAGFTPIGNLTVSGFFIGVYDGNFFSINDLFVSLTFESEIVNAGLFGRTDNSEIMNVYLKDSYIKGYSGSKSSSVGGIVGYAENNTNISACYVIAENIFSTGDAAFAGGIVGRLLNSSIIKCFSISSISSNGFSAFSGGIVGYAESNSSVTIGYSIGNISAISSTFADAGGVVGVLINSFTTECYSVGNVHSSSSFLTMHTKGGLVGYAENSSISNSFWDINTTDVILSAGGSVPSSLVIDCFGLSTEQMKQISSYTEYGWDFADVWGIDSIINDGYPYLRDTIDKITDIHENSDNIQLEKTKLYANFPNPFNPTTTIMYHIAVPDEVKLVIYNIKGQLVKTLVNDFQGVGNYSVVWHGDNDNANTVASGVYFYKLQTSSVSYIRRMVLVK